MMIEMHTQRERRGRPEELIGALAWFTRDVLRLERDFSRVTVKRRRNLARPIRRRRSAFRDLDGGADTLAAWATDHLRFQSCHVG